MNKRKGGGEGEEREEGKERKGMRRNNNHNHDDNNNTNISSLGDSHRKQLRRNMPANKKEMKEERKATPAHRRMARALFIYFRGGGSWGGRFKRHKVVYEL